MAIAETARKPQLRDHRTQIGAKLGDLLHHPHPNYRNRRIRSARFLRNTIYPYEMQGDEYESALTKAERLRQEGLGGIVYFPHPDLRSPAQAWMVMVLETPHMSEVEQSFGLAAHQDTPLTRFATYLEGVQVDLISTPNTLRRLIKKRDAGKKVTMPTKEERVMEREIYYDRTAETIEMGGLGLIAPAGTRQIRQTPFRYEPMREIIAAARKRGIKNMYFVPMGIGEKGLEEYRIGGLRPFRTDEIMIRECITLEELDAEIDMRNRQLNEQFGEENFEPVTYDTVLYEHLLLVLPKGLKPKLPPSEV